MGAEPIILPLVPAKGGDLENDLGLRLYLDSRFRGNDREKSLRRFGAGIGRFANRGADQFGAAATAGINGVFHLGGYRATGMIGHPSCANGAGHHQRG